MAIKTCIKALCALCACAILLSLRIASAQIPTVLPVHPGDTLKFEIKFDGPGADKVKTVRLYLGLKDGRVLPDQPGFDAGFGTGNLPQVAPDTFRPEIQVPVNAASGDYILYVSANFDPGSTQYSSPKDFELHMIHVENPKSITVPKITVKELP